MWARSAVLGRMQDDLKKLHAKIIHAAKRKDETLRRQFHHAQAQAFPGGHPQEREIAFVYFLNKYGREFPLMLTNRYDFVIDNNLASYACCKYHFYRMLDNYLGAMEPGGQILTDQHGMDFTVEENRWLLSFDDLRGLEEKFPVRVSRIEGTVYSIVRQAR